MSMYGNRNRKGGAKERKPRPPQTITITVNCTDIARENTHGYVVVRKPKAGNATERVFGLYRQGRLSWCASLKNATWFDVYVDALTALNGNSQNGEDMSIKAIAVVAAKDAKAS